MKPADLRKKLLPILSGLGLYLVTTGISFAAFSYLATPPDIDFESPVPENGELVIDPSAPKTEVCPINGKLYTETERKVWEKRRPLAVMIENHSEARPQSGISQADVVYEAVAEGGITRFLAIFYCDVIAKDTILGPIRSARTYYLDWASEYGGRPLYVHVGGANLPGPANALGQIQEYGWGGRKGNDLNQFSIGYPTFWRDYERLGRTLATEHTMYSSTEKLWKEGFDRGWTNENPETQVDWQERFRPWKFTDEEVQGEEAIEINFGFWEGYKNYNVTWKYNSEDKVYERYNRSQIFKDLNDGQIVTASAVIVQFTKETGPIDELKHLLYDTTGRGNAIVFQNGKATEATWRKTGRTDRTIFTSSGGKEISFSPGSIWVEIVPAGNSVDY